MDLASMAGERRARLVLALVLAAVALPFLPTLGFAFVHWDDHLHVFENPLVVNPHGSRWLDHLTTPGLGYPTPVTVLTYRVEAALFGLRHPGAFHATNVVLHLVVCTLAFGLSRRLGLGLAGAALATLVFGLHPACAEPVSWISGRKDLLALGFGLGAVTLSLPDASGRDGVRRRIASVALFALALLCKPVSAYVMLMVAAVRLRTAPADARPTARELARLVAPYLALVAVVVPVALIGQRNNGALEHRGLGLYLRDIWFALGFHLRLAALVEETSAKYLPTHPSPFDPGVDLAPFVFAALVVALLRWLPRERRSLAGFGLVWAAMAYLPSSNVLPLTRFLADSYLYGPMIGLGWTLGVALDHLVAVAGDRSKLVAIATPTVTALFLGLLALSTSSRFHDSVTLWSQVYERYPSDYRVCRNLAIAWYDVASAREALAAVDRCIERFGPENFEMNRAEALYLLDRLDEAQLWFDRAASRPRAAGTPPDPKLAYYRERMRVRRAALAHAPGPAVTPSPR